MASSTAIQKTIGIIGAAIAGPTFALQILSHPVLCKSYRPILFDRGRDPRTGSEEDRQQSGGAAIGIFANGIYPLYQLGLKDAFDKTSTQTPTTSFWAESQGRAEYLGSLQDSGSAADLQRGISVMERQRLQTLLVDRVQELGGSIQWQHSLERLERIVGADQEKKVRACFNNSMSYDLDLVVGADGAYSKVRKHILTELNAKTAEERWMPEHCGMTGLYSVSSSVDVVENTVRPGVLDETHGIWLTPGIISTSPLPDGKMRWDVVLPEANPPSSERSADVPTTASTQSETTWESKIIPNFYSRDYTAGILRRMAELPHPVTGTFNSLLTSSERIIHTPLRQRVWEAHEIQNQNIVLIGDAARMMLPSSGQGTSFAIEDATVLANALLNNPPNPDGDLSAALTQYAKERVPRSKKMATVAYWAGKLGMGETWYWRILRTLSTKPFVFGKSSTSSMDTSQQWPFNARYDVRSE